MKKRKSEERKMEKWKNGKMENYTTNFQCKLVNYQLSITHQVTITHHSPPVPAGGEKKGHGLTIDSDEGRKIEK